MSLPMTITGRLVFYRVSHMNVTVPVLLMLFLHILNDIGELPLYSLRLIRFQKAA
jgi:hypothetical protein